MTTDNNAKKEGSATPVEKEKEKVELKADKKEPEKKELEKKEAEPKIIEAAAPEKIEKKEVRLAEEDTFQRGPVYVSLIIVAIICYLLGVVTADYFKTTVKTTAKEKTVEGGIQVGNSPTKGIKDPKVSVVAFLDYDMLGARVNRVLNRILGDFKDDIQVVFKHNPKRRVARDIARALISANNQNKFWEYYDKVMSNPREINKLKKKELSKIAEELKLDMRKFNTDMRSTDARKVLAEDLRQAKDLDIKRGNHIFINGQLLTGRDVASYKKVREILEAELKVVKDQLAKGKSLAKIIKERYGANLKRVSKKDDIYKLPVGNSPYFGAQDAKVTIIEFSEFKCPYCQRITAPLKEAVKAYKDSAKLVFKHFIIHPQSAQIPAEASLAAAEQGKFWEMHDLLFNNMKENTDIAKATEYAKQLGLDVEKFKKALEEGTYKAQVMADMQVGRTFDVRGTPSIFINGKPYKGRRGVEDFKKAIQEEINAADELIKKGVALKDVYTELTKNGMEKASAQQPRDDRKMKRPEMDTKTVWKVELKDSPWKGEKDAQITMVIFSDFQCPYCKRVGGMVDELEKLYKGKIKVVFKSYPLPFHKDAMLAHEAALAANAEGKFFQMHDELFKNQRNLKKADLEKYAETLKLDMKKFKAALESHKYQEAVDTEMVEGFFVGIRGTPTIFINGRNTGQAQGVDDYKKIIEEELEKTNKMLEKGIKKADLYAELIKSGKDRKEMIIGKKSEVEVGDSPVKGSKEAPVTLVVFSDFQCGYCKRVSDTIMKLVKEFEGQIKVVYKAFPLKFHKDAFLAAEAVFAAGEQGKFWEMHDAIFNNMRKLKQEDLVKYAEEVGLDGKKFKEALESHKYKEMVEKDLEQGKKLQVRGTPNIFINGTNIRGALPYPIFKWVIKTELGTEKGGDPQIEKKPAPVKKPVLLKKPVPALKPPVKGNK